MSKLKDSAKALEVYRMKAAVEKSFDDQKNDLDTKRLKIHSTAAMDGRIFIQYIALILLSYMREQLNKGEWFKRNNNIQLNLCELYEQRKKRKPKYTTPASNRQS